MADPKHSPIYVPGPDSHHFIRDELKVTSQVVPWCVKVALLLNDFLCEYGHEHDLHAAIFYNLYAARSNYVGPQYRAAAGPALCCAPWQW
jgi:hypothetical protein